MNLALPPAMGPPEMGSLGGDGRDIDQGRETRGMIGGWACTGLFGYNEW